VSESKEIVVAEQPQQLITIEPTKYVELVFEPFAKQYADAVDAVREVAYDIKTTAGMAVAIKHRAVFRDIRVASEKARKLRKAPILEIGKLLDSRQGEIESTLLPLETLFDEEIKAEEKRKDDEKIAKAVAESARITAIRKRIAETQAIPSMLVGKSSETIAAAIESLEAVPITMDDWAEFCGEAEMTKLAALDKLKEMHAAQVAHESEQARLTAEREAIERERAEIEERRRKAAADFAEQQRVAAAARAEQEAKDKAERERVEAEQRAANERAAEAMRQQQAEHEARMRAQQEEIDRQQAEIDRARAEQERIAQEAMEAAEAEAKLESDHAEALEENARIDAAAELLRQQAVEARMRREQQERERAETLAARYAPEPTGGTWSVGKTWGSIVTTAEIAGSPGTGHNDAEYYGGNLICESVWRPADACVLAAAHDMFDLLKELIDIEGPQPGTAEWAAKVQAVLAKATYVPEVQPEAQAA
jgi:hypothetical protein